MERLKGTKRLFRLQLRLDRWKLPLWIGLTIALMYVSLESLKGAYNTVEQITLYAATTAPSLAGRLLGGVLTGPSIGEITIIETFMLLVVMVCLTNIFLVVRHTRKNEEAGREEVIRSLTVGRQAGLTSTLMLAVVVNVVFALGIFATYLANDFAIEGAMLYSVGVGLMGVFFAGVAAVTAQLFENARSASGFASLVLAVSWLVRGIGDASGRVDANGLGAETGWLSYFSPLGWVTNTMPFSDGEQVWPLGLLLLGTTALIVGAYALLSQRDMGGSTFVSKPGKAHASRMLLSPLGLIWRLNRVAFASWCVAMVIMGITVGAIVEEFKALIEGNETMREILVAYGGGSAVDIMFAAMFAIIGVTVTAYALQIISRIQAEETSGRLELMLSTQHSRLRWVIGYAAFAIVSSGVILYATGIAAGLTYGLISNDVWNQTWNMGLAILVGVPAIAVFVGLATVLFGLLPRLYTPLVWTSLGACLVIYQLGVVLKLPEWVLNVSPFTHTPAIPAEAIDFTPLWIMTAIAVGLLTIGLALYRQRDLVTE